MSRDSRGALRSGVFCLCASISWSVVAAADPVTPGARPEEKPSAAEPGASAPEELRAIPKLPDPFRFVDGSRVTRREDWDRRRAEILRLVEQHVYGPKPGRPEKVSGSFADGTLTVECADGERSISFEARISLPPRGEAPHPAIINLGRWITLPKAVLDELGIAVIYFPNDDLGRQFGARDRGKGKFYDLHGAEHPAGSLTAWAWGVSRLIDVLERTPEAGIDPKRLGVTGCSRNGKGALVCGAFDERIALTIPTESGSGGASSWRVADAMLASGRKVQTARQIVRENTWLAPAFAGFGESIERLPVDQHLVAALCAPRALLITENGAIDWLGPDACFVTAKAAREVWDALGVSDRMGFAQTSHGDHCRFKEVEELKAFCKRFLLGREADTDILTTDRELDVDLSDWIDWDTPDLSASSVAPEAPSGG